MAPYTNLPLAPAELSYLHTSLSAHPPVRPDGRSATQFRPLIAETDILPNANGSARICFADGTEAVVGVKAEVEKSARAAQGLAGGGGGGLEGTVLGYGGDKAAEDEEMDGSKSARGRNEWLDVSIEIPGMRDDDALPVFLSAMLAEALLADGTLVDRLCINTRYHWRLYIDILLLSQPLSYPLPLLSLTTHLALLATRLPALISEKDEDPLFNDDWEASTFLYPQTHPSKPAAAATKPPITLLVMSVGETILFDPTQAELAVADAVVAISCAPQPNPNNNKNQPGPALTTLALRTIDPPSRLTAAGVPTAVDGTKGGAAESAEAGLRRREAEPVGGVWRPPRGGVGRGVLRRMVDMVVEKGGVGEEVLAGLAGVDM